jgi:hypothetical protein
VKSKSAPHTDAGSALPLLLGGALFLILLGGVLLGSLQLLEQQRRLNGVSDTLALDLTTRLVEEPTSDVHSLTGFAQTDLSLIYPERRVQIGEVRVIGGASVAVALCEPAKPTLASVLGMTARQVCAQSRAQSQ